MADTHVISIFDNMNLKDNSNIGKKLLEKYGWVSGKGLGKNEDGIVEPIKAKSQFDYQGIGYCEPPDGWLQISSDYSSLLKNICGNYGETIQNGSVNNEDIDEKTKSSKSKIYYQKRMPSKNVRMPKKNDMKNIFGYEMPGFLSNDDDSDEIETIESVTEQQQVKRSIVNETTKKMKVEADDNDYKEAVLYNEGGPLRSEIIKMFCEHPKIADELFPGSNLSSIIGYPFL